MNVPVNSVCGCDPPQGHVIGIARPGGDGNHPAGCISDVQHPRPADAHVDRQTLDVPRAECGVVGHTEEVNHLLCGLPRQGVVAVIPPNVDPIHLWDGGGTDLSMRNRPGIGH